MPLKSAAQQNPTQDLLVPVNIGIIGYGIVGQATANGFNKSSGGKDKIVYYDKFKKTLSLKQVVTSSEFIFIALPTPMKKDESGIDLKIIEDSIKEITKITDGTDKVIVIKSTVAPGTTKRLELKYPKSNFCFNPEFLTEANYLDDFMNAEQTIIGANNDHVARRLAVTYKQRFPNTNVFLTDPTTAETVKYFKNAFLALKVTFANIFYDYCQAVGIKYEEVKKMAASDKRIVDAHLDVTTERGFGQKCFPKDLIALLGEFSRLGVDPAVLDTMWEYNKKVRKDHDWEDIPFAVEGNNKIKFSKFIAAD
jgi:UDPglucose 6-dehydrogenase